MSEFDISLLLTSPGIALIVGMVAQFIIKPWLVEKYPPEQHAQYKARFNSIVIGFGVILGLVAQLALNFPQSGSEIIGIVLAGAVTGFIGGVSAIGTAEWVSNTKESKNGN